MKKRINHQSKLLNHKTYFSYLYKHLSSLPFITSIKEIFIFLKKYILIGRILLIAKSVIMFLQAGAFFILFASIALTVVPLITIILLVIFIVRFKKYAHYNKQFQKLIGTYDFTVIFIDDDELSLSLEDNTVTQNICIYVSENPFFLLPKIIMRLDTKAYLISTGYFFSLKKNILEKNENKIFYKNDEVL